MPSDHSLSSPPGNAFDTPYKTGNHAPGERLPAIEAQVQTWRDARAQQRDAPAKPDAPEATEATEVEPHAMTGPFDLFQHLASPVPQQAQDQAQAAGAAAVLPQLGLPPAAPPEAPLPQVSLPLTPLPQAPQPGAPLPQAPLPQVPLPLTPLLPQAPQPGAPLPQAPLPQVPLPQAPLPQTPLPQAPLVDAPLPQALLPQTLLPGAPLSQTPLPQAMPPQAPQLQALPLQAPPPQALLPQALLTQALPPQALLPQTSLSAAPLPGAALPDAARPGAALPGAALPEAALPPAARPEPTQVEAVTKGMPRPGEMLSPLPMTTTQPPIVDQARDAPPEAVQPRHALAQAGATPAEPLQGKTNTEAGAAAGAATGVAAGSKTATEADTETETNTLAKPFDLFHAVPVARPVDAVDPMAVSITLQHSLVEMATRLLVSEGSSGQRRVQIEVADEKLPGVVVDVFEDEGRIVTRFTCSDESSRERLCVQAQWLADSLMERLQRDSRVQVQTDDPEDPYLLQVDANA